MFYIDKKSLEEYSRRVVTLIGENTVDSENIFTNSYCKSACDAYLDKTYTADTFPFRYHINDSNNIYIDGKRSDTLRFVHLANRQVLWKRKS